jgi:hypothetical protein
VAGEAQGHRGFGFEPGRSIHRIRLKNIKFD